jgi:two-component sensor histidine kinase
VKHHVNHRINIDVKEIKLKPIIPLGLIINELISNSIKHNLSKTDLSIEISMKEKGEGILFFEYKDNGNWNQDDSH